MVTSYNLLNSSWHRWLGDRDGQGIQPVDTAPKGQFLAQPSGELNDKWNE